VPAMPARSSMSAGGQEDNTFAGTMPLPASTKRRGRHATLMPFANALETSHVQNDQSIQRKQPCNIEEALLEVFVLRLKSFAGRAASKRR